MRIKVMLKIHVDTVLAAQFAEVCEKKDPTEQDKEYARAFWEAALTKENTANIQRCIAEQVCDKFKKTR